MSETIAISAYDMDTRPPSVEVSVRMCIVMMAVKMMVRISIIFESRLVASWSGSCLCSWLLRKKLDLHGVRSVGYFGVPRWLSGLSHACIPRVEVARVSWCPGCAHRDSRLVLCFALVFAPQRLFLSAIGCLGLRDPRKWGLFRVSR